jgi:hypothetical protein
MDLTWRFLIYYSLKSLSGKKDNKEGEKGEKKKEKEKEEIEERAKESRRRSWKGIIVMFQVVIKSTL